jgi:hypothetical protein
MIRKRSRMIGDSGGRPGRSEIFGNHSLLLKNHSLLFWGSNGGRRQKSAYSAPYDTPPLEGPSGGEKRDPVVGETSPEDLNVSLIGALRLRGPARAPETETTPITVASTPQHSVAFQRALVALEAHRRFVGFIQQHWIPLLES